MGTMFDEALDSLRYHLRSDSDSDCLTSSGKPSVYWNVDMYTGNTVNYWIDSLQAVWAAILVHHGEIKEAVCQHALHYFIWQVYGLPPERYDLVAEEPILYFYPLRPEFVESTYFLYRATRHPFYLHVGQQIITQLNRHARAPCGFATIHSVFDKSQEDRMESFFLSETLKYLYLLFDESNPVNTNEMDYVFSTQAHLFPVRRIRALARQLDPDPFQSRASPSSRTRLPGARVSNHTCAFPKLPNTPIPLDDNVWHKIGKFVHSKLNTFL